MDTEVKIPTLDMTTCFHVIEIPYLGHVITTKPSPWQLSYPHLLIKSVNLLTRMYLFYQTLYLSLEITVSQIFKIPTQLAFLLFNSSIYPIFGCPSQLWCVKEGFLLKICSRDGKDGMDSLHGGWVTDLHFSPDNCLLVSTGGYIKVQ